MIKKEAEKILKQKDPTTEIEDTWDVKIKVIPVIIGATETISKLFRIISQQHTGKALNQGTTENRHIGYRTHASESTNGKVQNIQHGSSITRTINCKYRTAVTLYNRNMVCFRYVIVNSLHKGDNK